MRHSSIFSACIRGTIIANWVCEYWIALVGDGGNMQKKNWPLMLSSLRKIALTPCKRTVQDKTAGKTLFFPSLDNLLSHTVHVDPNKLQLPACWNLAVFRWYLDATVRRMNAEWQQFFHGWKYADFARPTSRSSPHNLHELKDLAGGGFGFRSRADWQVCSCNVAFSSLENTSSLWNSKNPSWYAIRLRFICRIVRYQIKVPTIEFIFTTLQATT